MIKIKPKKCRGNGKAIGYGCDTLQLYRKYGLGRDCRCYSSWLLNTSEGKEIIEKCTISARKEVEKEKNKETREWKEAHKSIAKLIQEARKPFQQYIRTRDANNSCISCPNVDSEIWDAGHFKKAELYTGLIFDERNCFKQCRKCNTYLDGNEGEYRKRLIERFGQKWMDKLDDDSNLLRTYKFTREELCHIKEKYTNKIKQIKI
jgi:hypothetical protein